MDRVNTGRNWHAFEPSRMDAASEALELVQKIFSLASNLMQVDYEVVRDAAGAYQLSHRPREVDVDAETARPSIPTSPEVLGRHYVEGCRAASGWNRRSTRCVLNACLIGAALLSVAAVVVACVACPPLLAAELGAAAGMCMLTYLVLQSVRGRAARADARRGAGYTEDLRSMLAQLSAHPYAGNAEMHFDRRVTASQGGAGPSSATDSQAAA